MDHSPSACCCIITGRDQMRKAYVRPEATPLWPLTRLNYKGLQSCPAASMADATMLLPVAPNDCCTSPMPKYYPISKHCLIQASPFWSRSVPKWTSCDHIPVPHILPYVVGSVPIYTGEGCHLRQVHATITLV